MEILGAILKIVVSMALGYFLYKIKILNDTVNAAASKLISFGIAPCMIFSSVLALGSEQKNNITTLLIAGVAMYVLFAILAFIAARILRLKKEISGIYEATLVFGNSAFLGFPVGQALMGDIGVSYLAVLNMHQNVFCWSYGVFLLTLGQTGKKSLSLKKMINPPIIASLIALAFYFLNIKVPALVMVPIDFISQICSPLSMIIMGATIASYPILSLFTKWKHYVLSFIRLIVFPLAMFLIARLFLGAGELAQALTIHAMMPTAVIVSMAAIMYDSDSKTTSSVTGLMNIFCIGTIPLMWFIINAI